MRQPIRVAGIVVKDNHILLIHRIKQGKEYYVLPGGGVEDEEGNEEALLREMKEETCLDVKLKQQVYLHDYGKNKEYYYLCQYLGGQPCLSPDSIEARIMGKHDFYEPLWIKIDRLPSLLMYPLEIRDWLIPDLKNGFQDEVKIRKIDPEKLRQELNS